MVLAGYIPLVLGEDCRFEGLQEMVVVVMVGWVLTRYWTAS